MPYIDRDSRTKFKEPIKALWDLIGTDGELNYVITMLAINFVDKQGGDTYSNIGRALMAMEMAKLEFYRRKAAAYEQLKSLQNGDVYG